jgi:hypothetical protein
MRGEGDRMLDINLQIGVSKAIRNVIVNSLQSIADFALEEARNGLVDKIGKNLESYRKRATDRLQEMHVELSRVEHVIGRPAGKWMAWDLAKVIAMIQSINDGMTTADDAFPISSVREREATGESATTSTSVESAVEDGAARASAPTAEEEISPAKEHFQSPEQYFEYAETMIDQLIDDGNADPKQARLWFNSEFQRKLRTEHSISVDDVTKFSERKFGK